ncbi:MAG: hypothetical protein EZS28_014472, partial [Streblomastix strix]
IGEHLRSMKKKEMFGNLLFYVESCNSGSLFSDLLQYFQVVSLQNPKFISDSEHT